MSGREIMAEAILTAGKCMGALAHRSAATFEQKIVDFQIEALTAAGYRILGPAEVDPVTVERCAEAVERSPELAAVGEFDGEYDGLGRDVAAEVRSLGDGR